MRICVALSHPFSYASTAECAICSPSVHGAVSPCALLTACFVSVQAAFPFSPLARCFNRAACHVDVDAAFCVCVCVRRRLTKHKDPKRSRPEGCSCPWKWLGTAQSGGFIAFGSRGAVSDARRVFSARRIARVTRLWHDDRSHLSGRAPSLLTEPTSTCIFDFGVFLQRFLVYEMEIEQVWLNEPLACSLLLRLQRSNASNSSKRAFGSGLAFSTNATPPQTPLDRIPDAHASSSSSSSSHDRKQGKDPIQSLV